MKRGTYRVVEPPLWAALVVLPMMVFDYVYDFYRQNVLERWINESE